MGRTLSDRAAGLAVVSALTHSVAGLTSVFFVDAGAGRAKRSRSKAGGRSAADDERQRRPEGSDPRSAEVRPLARGCRRTLSPAALPVAEQSSRAGAVTAVGVRRP